MAASRKNLLDFFNKNEDEQMQKEQTTITKQTQNKTQQAHSEIIDSWLKQNNIKLDPQVKLLDTQILENCIKEKLFEEIPDYHKFLKKLPTLVKEPLSRELYGEQLEGLYKRRLALIKSNGLTGDHLTREKELAFAAWILFELKKNKVYLPIHIIQSFCQKQEIDFSDFFEVLVKHPVYKNLYTSRDIRNAEITIEKWLRKATCLQIEQPEYIEALDEHQNEVVKSILTSPFSALQGSAGCGKTTTVSEIINIITSHKEICIIAAAFTHKAKKCVEQRIKKMGLEKDVIISTIHSLVYTLKNNTASNVFLILDEASMIDYDLLGELAKIMLANCAFYQLCFVGDFFQIQPVGRGEFFRQIVESKNKCVQFLNKCYRTDNLDLFKAFENVRSGILPKSTSNFKITTVENDKEVSSTVGKVIHHYLNKYQILCWQNKHIWMINQWVQKALLIHKLIEPQSYKGFHVNDKVVYHGENTDTITNSTYGIVREVKPRSITIEWDDNHKADYVDVHNISLAYAISVHKSQGSEYKHVLVVCYDIDKMMGCLDKRWLYTSITRAQHDVHIITTHGLERFVNQTLKEIPINNLNTDI